jgi:hypothetical protein
MGFLKKFFRNVLRDGSIPAGTSSFESLSEDELESHLGVSRYGDFQLTDEQARTTVPVLMGACTRQRLFDLFMDLLDPMGAVVDTVLETSHHRDRRGHVDLYREHIDLPVLKSVLWEYEELLLNDGCTGLAVLNPEVPREIQFDEHKLLIVYGNELDEFEAVFRDSGIARDEQMKFITEAEHVHSSSEHYARLFDEFRTRLGMDEYGEG